MNQRRPYTGLTYKHDLIEKAVTFLPTHTVAEIGLGTGYSCFELAERTACVTGIDIDAGLIAALEEYAAEYGKLKLLCSNVTAEPPPRELRSRMDIVFSIDALQYAASPEKFMAYIAALLKPEGIAVVCFPNETDEEIEGVVNFKRYESLRETIAAAGLFPDSIQVARPTRWFKFISGNPLNRAKRVPVRKHCGGKTFPPAFSGTVAYRLIMEKQGASWPVRIYTKCIRALLRAGGVYKSFDTRDIYGRYVVLRLSRKKRQG
jgi:SAM-dependent methyltransferase